MRFCQNSNFILCAIKALFFINKKPYPSWVLNETTCRFEAPIAYPADGSREKNYEWNEETTSWDEQ